jgi:uncharacterized protein HemX
MKQPKSVVEYAQELVAAEQQLEALSGTVREGKATKVTVRGIQDTNWLIAELKRRLTLAK